jgi:hypothetical protein
VSHGDGRRLQANARDPRKGLLRSGIDRDLAQAMGTRRGIFTSMSAQTDSFAVAAIGKMSARAFPVAPCTCIPDSERQSLLCSCTPRPSAPR